MALKALLILMSPQRARCLERWEQRLLKASGDNKAESSRATLVVVRSHARWKMQQ